MRRITNEMCSQGADGESLATQQAGVRVLKCRGSPHLAGRVQHRQAQREGRRGGRLQPPKDGHEEREDALIGSQ